MDPVTFCSVLAGLEVIGARQVSPTTIELDFFWQYDPATILVSVEDYHRCFPEIELPELPESE